MSNSLVMIVDDQGRRLCRDGSWRSFALFGTHRSCVRTYRSAGTAARTARKYGGRIAVVTSDDIVTREVEAGGTVVVRHPVHDMPGFEHVDNQSILDYVRPM